MSLAFFLVIAPPLAAGVGLQVVTLTLGIGGTGLGIMLAHLVPAGYLTLFAAGVFINMEPAIEGARRAPSAPRATGLVTRAAAHAHRISLKALCSGRLSRGDNSR